MFRKNCFISIKLYFYDISKVSFFFFCPFRMGTLLFTIAHRSLSPITNVTYNRYVQNRRTLVSSEIEYCLKVDQNAYY